MTCVYAIDVWQYWNYTYLNPRYDVLPRNHMIYNKAHLEFLQWLVLPGFSSRVLSFPALPSMDAERLALFKLLLNPNTL